MPRTNVAFLLLSFAVTLTLFLVSEQVLLSIIIGNASQHW